MNRKQFLVSAASAALLEPIAAASNADAAPEGPLIISIPPTAHYLEDRVGVFSDPVTGASFIKEKARPARIIQMPAICPHINVTLQNVSDHPIRIWQENSSWGASNLSLRIFAVNGKPLPHSVFVKRTPFVFLANQAEAEMVLPGETILRTMHLAPPYLKPSANSWAYRDFPAALTGGYLTVLTQAVFQIHADRFTTEQAVWTGEITSLIHEYEVQSIKIPT